MTVTEESPSPAHYFGNDIGVKRRLYDALWGEECVFHWLPVKPKIQTLQESPYCVSNLWITWNPSIHSYNKTIKQGQLYQRGILTEREV